MIGTTYKHPLYERKSPVLAGGDYITTESGTGLVHTAPGHGQEDYLTGLKNGLDLLSPVDDVGKFTIEAGDQFVGMSVLGDGNQAIIEALTETGSLLKAEDYSHKYPYDWRTKKPTIFRATDQWFASVEGFRDDAMDAIDEVSCKRGIHVIDSIQEIRWPCMSVSNLILRFQLYFRFVGFLILVKIALHPSCKEEEIGAFPVKDRGVYLYRCFMTEKPETMFCWMRTLSAT